MSFTGARLYPHHDEQYCGVTQEVLRFGDYREDRTGVGTYAIFAERMRFQMDDGFPAVTTKYLSFRSVLAELLWMLCGDHDNNHLRALGVHIWDGNANDPRWREKAEFEGDVGRNYGVQWRDWVSPDGRHVDQISEVIRCIKETPADRRMIFSAWNVGEIELTSLPACHALAQFFVSRGEELSVQMYQRSCDLFLGVPFNMAQYALILHLFAQLTGLKPGRFTHIMGDTHLYRNHLEQAREQITRKPFPAPKLWLNPEIRTLRDVEEVYRDLLKRAGPENKPKPLKILDEVAHLIDYQSHSKLEAQMAV